MFMRGNGIEIESEKGWIGRGSGERGIVRGGIERENEIGREEKEGRGLRGKD